MRNSQESLLRLQERTEKMELRRINEIDAKAQWEYTTALPEDENGLTNPYNGVSS